MSAAKIYRDFDRKTLDDQYRIRDSVPPDEFDAILARYGTDSARVRGEIECREDVAFGPSADEVLDIFPAGPGAPLFVFIHGGYWRVLSHKDASFMAENFTARGAAVAAVNYSLAPGVDLDEIVRQCRAAIAWLYHHGADFGADPERIFVCGSSAGGHLTGMALAGGWHAAFGVPDDVIKGACALSGLHDLEPIRLSEVNDWIRLDEISARRNSPIHHLPERGCPLIVSYGGNETAEFKRQTDDYAAAWRARGFGCAHFDGARFNHFDIVFDLCAADGGLAGAIFAQMGI